MKNEYTLDISWSTIIKLSVAATILYFLYSLRQFLVLFLFAFIISILFEPAIEWFGRHRVPRLLAVIFIYLSILGIFSMSVYFSLPYFISEIQYFSESFPQTFSDFFGKVAPFFQKIGFESFRDLNTFLADIQAKSEEMGANIFSSFLVIFGGVFNAFFTLTVAVFLSLERKGIEKGLLLLFPKKYENYLLNAWLSSQKKITGWFLMRIIGVIFVGISTYFALYVLNVEYPISLALIAGIFDFVIFIGPSFAAVIIFAVISITNIYQAFFALIAFGLIQFIENAILMPSLSKRVIKVSPVLVLVALFIGGKFWGVLGAILVVPLAGILMDFFKDFLQKNKEEETDVSIEK